jgi:PEP-CTERM motif
MILFALAAAGFALGASLWHPSTLEVTDAGESQETPPGAADPRGDDRPVYPYSIISGGAHSASELKAAIDADPVVRTHFANFDLTKTRVVTLDAPRVAHVSYRVGNTVYWTRKTVVLGTGEKILTDGQHVARTRCGNQVADVPGVIAADEPAPTVLDTPLSALPRGPLSGLTIRLAAPGVGGPGNTPSSVGGPGPLPAGSPTGGGIGGPGGVGRTTTPTTTPSLQPSDGDHATPDTNQDPVTPENPVGGPSGGPGNPGNPNLPPNPLSADVIPSLQTPPPGGQPPATFGPPSGPPEGPPHTDDPPSNPPGQPTPVPEPSTIVLVGASAGAWLARRRRTRRA